MARPGPAKAEIRSDPAQSQRQARYGDIESFPVCVPVRTGRNRRKSGAKRVHLPIIYSNVTGLSHAWSAGGGDDAFDSCHAKGNCGHLTDTEEFINRADQCLYAAKKGGRNMVKCETDPDIGFDAAAA